MLSEVRSGENVPEFRQPVNPANVGPKRSRSRQLGDEANHRHTGVYGSVAEVTRPLMVRPFQRQLSCSPDFQFHNGPGRDSRLHLEVDRSGRLGRSSHEASEAGLPARHCPFGHAAQ